MRDRENNLIKLAKQPNGHVMVLGRSGMGKTFWNYRKMEEAFETGKSILIFDYFGSYTRQEMEKAEFLYINEVLELNPQSNPIYWMSDYQDSESFCMDFADSIYSIFKTESYFQKKWLRRAVCDHVANHSFLTLPSFLNTLEAWYELCLSEGGSSEDYDNIKRLLSRLSPYENAKNIFIKNQSSIKGVRKQIKIYQFSECSKLEREFFTNLFLHLLWKETVHNKKTRYDLVLLDEFQNLSLETEGAFYSILREGRRFGLNLLLSTQYISSYKKNEVEALLQAGNILLFNPTPTDLEFTAKLIDFNDKKTWKGILKNLKIGEAVLKGSYFVNNGTKIRNTPIICKI